MKWFDNLPDAVHALILVGIILLIVLIGSVLKRTQDRDPYEDEYPE